MGGGAAACEIFFFSSPRNPTGSPSILRSRTSPIDVQTWIGTKEEHTGEKPVIPPCPLPPAQMDALREQIRRIEAGDRVSRGLLPFGVPEIDDRLPGGGLALGALHEVAGGANGAIHGAAAALSRPASWPAPMARFCGAWGGAICSRRPWPRPGFIPTG